MKLDQKAIETISTSAVKNSIVTSPFLDQFIPDNDKEPSWDGNVYIYEDNSKKKSKLKGRMSVQVKGKQFNDFSKEEIHFSMSITDLKNYLYDGGVVLFVVYIGNDGVSTKIYYSELTPIKLRLLIAKAKKQKSQTIKLKYFPNDGNKKATIFLNCLQNCQKQASFSEAKLYTLEELQNTGLLEGITIPFSGAGIDDPKTALLTNEIYIYANIKGSPIPQPLELLPEDLITEEIVCGQIKISDKIYYSEYKILKSADLTVYRFGKSFTISYKDLNSPYTIQYKGSSMIRTIAVDLDFILQCVEQGHFELNGISIPFDCNKAKFSDFDLDKEKIQLDFAKRSVKTLDMLNCSKDLDISKLTNMDIQIIKCLNIAFIDDKPVTGLRLDLPLVANISIGELIFILMFKQDKMKNDTYEIFDFFCTTMKVAYKNQDGKVVPISQFSIFKADILLKISNMRIDQLLPSFQDVESNDKYVEANYFMLELLSAYDKSNGQRDDLLQVAEEFAVWIKDFDDNSLEYSVKMLNYYQIIKRKRAFNIEEISELWNIVDNNLTSDICKVGAYLLLDQQVPATRYFDKLDENYK